MLLLLYLGGILLMFNLIFIYHDNHISLLLSFFPLIHTLISFSIFFGESFHGFHIKLCPKLLKFVMCGAKPGIDILIEIRTHFVIHLSPRLRVYDICLCAVEFRHDDNYVFWHKRKRYHLTLLFPTCWIVCASVTVVVVWSFPNYMCNTRGIWNVVRLLLPHPNAQRA